MIVRPPLYDTFELPTTYTLIQLEVGDWCKLMFTDESESITERMWVLITSQESGCEWTGTLDNIPFNLNDYELGDEIKFHPLDIVQTR